MFILQLLFNVKFISTENALMRFKISLINYEVDSGQPRAMGQRGIAA